MNDQHGGKASSPDERAIQQLYGDLVDDWDRADGASYGSRFTVDADYVAFDGTRTTGADQIGSSHQQFFDTFLKGSRLLGTIDSVRFLRDDVAVIHATANKLMPGEAEPAPEGESIQTFVGVKNDGQWLFAAFHSTRIQRI